MRDGTIRRQDPAGDEYELLDAAEGRRIERFGAHVTDRPSGAAYGAEWLASGLPAADLVYERADDGGGAWVRGGDTLPWLVRHAGLTLELRAAAGGQVGLFPEHAALWPWLAAVVAGAGTRLGRPPVLLSLFAYTGGTTLTIASAGGDVAHVDASRPAVAWARVNATHSGLGDAPVRWLVDDVAAFVARERRRGRRYDGVVLDPPSYGHGERRRTWRIATDLPPLLEALAGLIPEPQVVLLTAHTPGWDAGRLAELVTSAFAVDPETGDLRLEARTGRVLPLGSYARWAA
ncbi:MAG TPA: class I SAM-dependent methyltransferase [Candidatus Limnocylindrales bacterium]|nr:class I SAM-dependent methyltransferase [Candidatus Limnocylindrales bacterium]